MHVWNEIEDIALEMVVLITSLNVTSVMASYVASLDIYKG